MRLLKAGIIAILSACVALGAASAAFAYPADLTDPRTCADCHGREADESTETVAPTRKGPHGGYTAGTRKCATCHSVHDAPAGGVLLLPAATVKATCETCHDGTGGAGVYGVVKARTDMEQPAASHRVEATSTIPGGDGDTGGSAIGTFSGQGGTLTCSDCHSPHDSNTVEPFTGDRLRASVTSDTVYAAEKTNRLLKQMPSSAETSVSVYGAGWCATCHKGRVGQHGEDSGLMQSHPVMDSDEEYFYDNVQVVAGFDTTETAIGELGQDNRGYVMPIVDDPEVDPRPAPLCQQCHEDARDVGPRERGGEPMLSEDQTFTVNAYASMPSDETTDNPRFQVFPHESDVEYFLVRPVAETVDESRTPTYQLCLNCHSLRHDVPEEYLTCAEAGCHDQGDAIDIHQIRDTANGCACHTQTEVELSFACGDCHAPHADKHGSSPAPEWIQLYDRHEDNLPGTPENNYFSVEAECSMCHNVGDISALHANNCSTCHPAPRDSLVPEWGLGCSQGGCHEVYHADTLDAHYYTDQPLDDPATCTPCHDMSDPNWALRPNFCLNCHAAPDAPLTTLSDWRDEPYVGPAVVTFSTADADGKIGIGTTYYRIDDGPVTAGRSARMDEPGTYVLQYWSKNQYGAVEAPVNEVTVVVEADTEPPVTTTSDVTAGATYYATKTIRFNATDNSFLGPETTYYELYLAGTLVQSDTGTQLTVQPPATGTADYILHYWSVDHSGNVEERNSVSFAMAGGTATIRLIWGLEQDGDPPVGPPPADAEAWWRITRGSLVIEGSSQGWMPGGWDGVDDVTVDISATPYSVSVWWDEGYGEEDPKTGSLLVTEPGEIYRFWY
ncbi:MAG: cytochrome c3 family protein [Coriobacteriia bacterium]|nr:cytochrome c3 family protein [Coriobacteriia bacterium]